jgi:hypothetical protein
MAMANDNGKDQRQRQGRTTMAMANDNGKDQRQRQGRTAAARTNDSGIPAAADQESTRGTEH